MKNKIVNNLFKLWEHIGISNQLWHKEDGYSFVTSKDNAWPSQVFNLNEREIDLRDLSDKIIKESIPNAIAILENSDFEEQLVEHNFVFLSTVKAMYLDIEDEHVHIVSFKSIEKVNNKLKAMEFAKIATASFGYPVLASTIASLVNNASIEMFIGTHNEEYVSCGLILHENNGVSGLHMIGTIASCRGLGLGKIMTNKLLLAAYENKSKQVVLVASSSGEHIYTRIGFKTVGSLNSYVLEM